MAAINVKKVTTSLVQRRHRSNLNKATGFFTAECSADLRHVAVFVCFNYSIYGKICCNSYRFKLIETMPGCW